MKLKHVLRNAFTPNVSFFCVIENEFERKVQIYNKMLRMAKEVMVVVEGNTNYPRTYEVGDIRVSLNFLERYWTVELNKNIVANIKITSDDLLYSFYCGPKDLDIVEKAIEAYYTNLKKHVLEDNDIHKLLIEKNTEILNKELNA